MENTILAVVATQKDISKVSGAGYIFIADTEQDAQKLSMLLSRSLTAMSHDLENGVWIIVKH